MLLDTGAHALGQAEASGQVGAVAHVLLEDLGAVHRREDIMRVVAGELVLSEQIVAGGIDREVPRFFAAGSHIRRQAQQAATVDLEHGDAVKTAV